MYVFSVIVEKYNRQISKQSEMNAVQTLMTTSMLLHDIITAEYADVEQRLCLY